MSGKPHWLSGLSKILRAPTGDLRALAEAAGEDPRTLFIGTRLDGADLRGQDLRGLIFTHLDLARVQHDAETRLDPAGEAPVAEVAWDGAQGALVLLKTDRRDRDFLPALHEGARHGFAVYPATSEAAFRDAAKGFAGPKIVVLPFARRRRLAPHLEAFDRDTITLVIRHTAIDPFDRDDLAAARALPGPVVMATRSTMSGGGSLPLLTGAALDALLLLITNWERLGKVLREQPVSYLLRGVGQRPDPQNDAWFRVLAQATRGGLTGCGGVALIPRERAEDMAELCSDLFPEVRRQRVMELAPARRKSWAAVLFDPLKRGAPAELGYGGAVRRVLSRNGWMFTPDTREDEHEYAEVTRFSGRPWSGASLNTSVENPPASYVDILPDAVLRQIELEPIRTFGVTERANERAIVSHLVTRGELLVTASDLSFFLSTSHSIWPLITQQAVRIARATDKVGRTQYFSLLLREAFRADRTGEEGDPGPLIEALNDHEFSERYRLSLRLLRWTPFDASWNVQLASVMQRTGSRGVLQFRLDMTQQGPALDGFAPLSAAVQFPGPPAP